MTKIWFITGSSRGLGRSLTEAVLASGDKVAATARNPETLNDLVEKYPDQIYPVKLDVTQYDDVYGAVADVVAHFGRVFLPMSLGCAPGTTPVEHRSL